VSTRVTFGTTDSTNHDAKAQAERGREKSVAFGDGEIAIRWDPAQRNVNTDDCSTKNTS
jgi:hypothetical protein